MTRSESSAAPVAPSGRHEIVDILRGFALFGVLLSNVLWTTQEFALDDAQRAALPLHGASEIVELLVLWFVGFKFYTIFSILFGLGFAIQLERLQRRGPGAAATYVRRSLVLLAIGIAHAVFLWFGDILQFYAALGLVLILLRNRSDRFLSGSALAIALFVGSMPALHSIFGSEPAGSDKAARFAAMTEGSYLDLIRMHWQFQVATWSDVSLSQDGFVYWILSILWKFLFGFWLGRRRVFRDLDRYLPVFRRWWKPALGFGVFGNGLLVAGIVAYEAWLPEAAFPVNLLWIVVEAGILALALAYMLGIAILHTKRRTRRTLDALAPVGRMALTNYLTHSVLYLFLFNGIGLGWLGAMNAIHGLVLSIAIFAAQILVSRWWLSRFEFGPMEWIWRCLTYGRRLPIRSR